MSADLFKKCAHKFSTMEFPPGEPVYGPGGRAHAVTVVCDRFKGDALANGCDKPGCPMVGNPKKPVGKRRDYVVVEDFELSLEDSARFEEMIEQADKDAVARKKMIKQADKKKPKRSP